MFNRPRRVCALWQHYSYAMYAYVGCRGKWNFHACVGVATVIKCLLLMKRNLLHDIISLYLYMSSHINKFAPI